MKKLSIEEKAKRYDEAIEKANSLWHYKSEPCFLDISEIFPELKESEDETIRKRLIEYFQEYKSTGIEGFANGLKINSIVAWLEKQANRDIHLLELKAKAYDDAKERISYAYNQNRVSISFINEIFLNLSYYENQFNNVNKIEPKFKVGDWVIDKQRLVHQIKNVVENVTNHTFGYDIVGGGYFNDNSDVRLWTIKDARWGDVLAFDDNIIVIFKDLYNDTTFHSYCHIENDVLNISQVDMPDWWESKGFHPATKEQCDLFFQKMKEKGYKWNDNTKEVIKL